MSTFVGDFEVTSKLTGTVFQCRVSHMWNGIATRQADPIDTKFFVDGKALVLGLAHTAFVNFRERTGRDLTAREASFIAAEYLRERLEERDERPLYDVSVKQGGDRAVIPRHKAGRQRKPSENEPLLGGLNGQKNEGGGEKKSDGDGDDASEGETALQAIRDEAAEKHSAKAAH